MCYSFVFFFNCLLISILLPVDTRVRLSYPNENYHRSVATVDAPIARYSKAARSRVEDLSRLKKIRFADRVSGEDSTGVLTSGRKGEGGQWGSQLERKRDTEIDSERNKKWSVDSVATPGNEHDDDHRFCYDHYLALSTFTFSLYLEDRARLATSVASESIFIRVSSVRRSRKQRLQQYRVEHKIKYELKFSGTAGPLKYDLPQIHMLQII